MRFAFYFADYVKSFSLKSLRNGDIGAGGGVVRSRILFWLAKLGHEIFILNHVDENSVDGVRSVRVGQFTEIPQVIDNLGGVDLFVFNYDDYSSLLGDLPVPGARAKVIWAGNAFPPEFALKIDNLRIHRAVCVSHAHRESHRLYPNFSRIEMAYSGIDLDIIDNSPEVKREDNLIIFLGAPKDSKGFHNLLNSWPLIREKRPQARLRVLGSALLHDPSAKLGWTGMLDESFEAKYLDPLVGSSRDLEKIGIEFAGLLPSRDVHIELKRAAIAVVNMNFTGSFETYCRSAIEVQASGTPVIGAARGALNEVIRDGETGILIAEPEPEKISEVFVDLLDNSEMRRNYGRAGSEWARGKIGNYEKLASDWVGIAERTLRDEPASYPKRYFQDFLRVAGYGRFRMAAKRILKISSE
ncbi:MAG: glycosyltransferase family 4 protein [Nitrospinaceae bacterium]|jgi:glycosyltransferase involved in cell wall biosynthesis|nr:glycosyltransferase family 4 protein [Nitrospinaceae bacterium]MBT5368208.1 glycosyltransferase family 4 protein [Nitrospinaceae bacterium]MBT6395756.1 glycosyltransferase family 4 protein [Nitrospinaceae bacterium]